MGVMQEGAPRQVVAVVVTSVGRIALFRRSQEVSHDRGLWHCVTGYLPPGVAARAQAVEELHEETGLHREAFDGIRTGPVLTLAGQHEDTWLVHTFTCEIPSSGMRLNWEHDAMRWIAPGGVPAPGQVPWLVDVVDALREPALAPARPAGADLPRSTTRPYPCGH